MNANEYINGMADLIRTTGADVRIEDIDGKKRIAAKFHSVSEMNAEMKKAFIANAETLKALNAGLKALRASGEIKSASQGYAPLVLERAIEFRMDFGF
ncbi:hypothetical protein [Enterococcus faecium]|uniref:hypothetical protein n=1 Tax=Enterococcus faecium TaxID=1352 RepID=UPI003DA32CF8